MFKRVCVFRIKPDQEVFSEINRYCQSNNITSGIILGIIGSLKSATLSYLMELPAKYKEINYEGPLEIVSALGSIAFIENSSAVHIHMHISNENSCQGGHLVRGTVFSTAEVVLGELDFQVYRQYDQHTGLNEIVS